MMHLTQTIIGGVAVIGALQFAVLEPIKRATLPPPPPIVVHSLTWDNGVIIQDRTVDAGGKFTAAWAAEIRDTASGRIVPDCMGEGVWTYSPGRLAAEVPLVEWVGNDRCRLGVGSYQALATFSAGTFQTTARSKVFTVGADQ